MPNDDLIASYRLLASSLDPLIQKLLAEKNTTAAQHAGQAQADLRSACVNLIADDIGQLLDASSDQAAVQAKKSLLQATNALKRGAAAIARDEQHLTAVVGIASSAAKLACSLSPLNIPNIMGACDRTIHLLSSA